MMATKVYVVELQSPYDGGHAVQVFSTLTLAKEYCEKQEDFTKWGQLPTPEGVGLSREVQRKS